MDHRMMIARNSMTQSSETYQANWCGTFGVAKTLGELATVIVVLSVSRSKSFSFSHYLIWNLPNHIYENSRYNQIVGLDANACTVMKQCDCDLCSLSPNGEDADSCFCWIFDLTRSFCSFGIVGATVFAILSLVIGCPLKFWLTSPTCRTRRAFPDLKELLPRCHWSAIDICKLDCRSIKPVILD